MHGDLRAGLAGAGIGRGLGIVAAKAQDVIGQIFVGVYNQHSRFRKGIILSRCSPGVNQPGSDLPVDLTHRVRAQFVRINPAQVIYLHCLGFVAVQQGAVEGVQRDLEMGIRVAEYAYQWSNTDRGFQLF